MPMSKKKNNKPVRPLPVGQVAINLMSDGTVNVNFPEDYFQTLQALNMAHVAVVKHFFKGIAENRFGENGVKKGSSIIIAKPGQVPA
jgi:hypothetical protein